MAATKVGAAGLYRAGGAAAVAALAYGTKLLPAVDLIAGPGNAYTTAAKWLVSADVGIDALQGPSELIVIGSRDADPASVILDLEAQAEHGGRPFAALLSDDEGLLAVVAAVVSRVGSRDGMIALYRVPSLRSGRRGRGVRRPGTPASRGRARGTARRWDPQCRCGLHRHQDRGGLRRLRGRLEPLPAHRWLGAVVIAAAGRGLRAVVDPRDRTRRHQRSGERRVRDRAARGDGLSRRVDGAAPLAIAASTRRVFVPAHRADRWSERRSSGESISMPSRAMRQYLSVAARGATVRGEAVVTEERCQA